MGWLTPELAAVLGPTGVLVVVLGFVAIKTIRDPEPRKLADAYFQQALTDARKTSAAAIAALEADLESLQARVRDIGNELTRMTDEAATWRRRAVDLGYEEKAAE